MDDATWFAAGLLVLALLSGATALDVGGPPIAGERTDEVVELRDGSDRLWPYTSKRHSFSSRTLAINLVVYADPATTRRLMTHRGDAEWQPTENETEDTDTASIANVEYDDSEDRLVWSDARGARRYTYVESPDGNGAWLEERYQLHDGSYLGARDHVRAYAARDGGWTALQAHSEHWDWFRLRHTVSGIADAQRRVEIDFMRTLSVDRVVRVYAGNGGTADGHGWISTIEVGTTVAALALAGPALARRGLDRLRDDARASAIALGPAVGPAGLYLAVRAVGVALETTFPGTSPKVFAGLLYPVIAVGIPASAALLARPHRPIRAFALVATGLGVAFVLDYAALGVAVLPIRAILHRAAVLVSAGMVAAVGATATADRWHALLVVACWAATLSLPLVGAI
ncbi:hypothetical protein ACFQPA_06435 [Halomarina halobia]|uniref:Uncharacterized protein n=1 Tax=Halomarina halobia TaxID=3033386 RepID=A0ABD6A760_9EURY|nr:hypothetical protein [Halomarina sp. PSR21]